MYSERLITRVILLVIHVILLCRCLSQSTESADVTCCRRSDVVLCVHSLPLTILSFFTRLNFPTLSFLFSSSSLPFPFFFSSSHLALSSPLPFPSGQSTGRADVTFCKRSDAVLCVQRFHNVALDGTPMAVQLSGESTQTAAPVAPFTASVRESVRESNSSQSNARGDGNVRDGLFGTAMGAKSERRERPEKQERAPRDPSFSVTMRGPDAVVQPFGGGNSRSCYSLSVCRSVCSSVYVSP